MAGRFRRVRSVGDALFSGQPVLGAGYVLAERYEVISLLGEGGMGAVYKAKDISLNRVIALKTIRREYSGNQAILERFKQELILSTQVTHKNVVRIYDLGEAEGIKFITMEYIEGEDLRTLIHQRAKLPPEEVVDIVAQICRALDAAHSVGVIHRDLKPQNVMRDQNGRVVVMDFGLARTLEGDGMTLSGALVGTMEYMSPEQALSKPLDQRSDIFSLGLIFYELLTGQTPFRADSALASLILRTQERAAPVTQFDSSIAGPLDRMVNRCLEREVGQRYQNARRAAERSGVVAGEGRCRDFDVAGRSVCGGSDSECLVVEEALVGLGCGLGAAVLAVGGYWGVHARGRRRLRRMCDACRADVAGDSAVSQYVGGCEERLDGRERGGHAEYGYWSVGASADGFDGPAAAGAVGLAGGSGSGDRSGYGAAGGGVQQCGYCGVGQVCLVWRSDRDRCDDSRSEAGAEYADQGAGAGEGSSGGDRQPGGFGAEEFVALCRSGRGVEGAVVQAELDVGGGAARLQRGLGADARGEEPGCVEEVQAATSEDPQFALALSRLAEVQSELGFESDAEQSSRRAVELAGSENLPLAGEVFDYGDECADFEEYAGGDQGLRDSWRRAGRAMETCCTTWARCMWGRAILRRRGACSRRFCRWTRRTSRRCGRWGWWRIRWAIRRLRWTR